MWAFKNLDHGKVAVVGGGRWMAVVTGVPENDMWRPCAKLSVTHLFFILAIIYRWPLPTTMLAAHLIGKADTAKRIKSNQCTSGMLHKPLARVAAMIRPITA